MEFVLVVDALVSFFGRRVSAGIGEQVIHLVQKIDLVLLQAIADIAILIAKVCVLEPTVELPEIRYLVANILAIDSRNLCMPLVYTEFAAAM